MSKVKTSLIALLCLVALASVSCETVSTTVEIQDLSIAYAQGPSSLSPLSFEVQNRQALANIYEPLIMTDKTFNAKTALAVSWGRRSDLVWDIHLRKGVAFHSGDVLTAKDVLYSLNQARSDSSELSSLLSSIKEIRTINDHRLEIETHLPDPLLLSRLIHVYIYPDGTQDFEIPVGTGPFRAKLIQNGNLELERFDSYWGERPQSKKLTIRTISSANDRVQAFQNGNVDVLANVPPQKVSDLTWQGKQIVTFPSLELSFLMFNSDSILNDQQLRQAIWLTIGDDYAEELGGGFLRPANQYAANGIFGFSSEIEDRQLSLERAIELRGEGPELTLTLDLPEGLEALGEKMDQDLAAINIDLEVRSWPINEYEQQILSGNTELYFFGWKHDLGDVGDFYNSVVHGTGEFNAIALNDPVLNQMIEKSQTLLDIAERRVLLEDIAEGLLDKQLVMPLFESTLIYGFQPELIWDVRLDSQILADEIFLNP